MPHLAVSLLKQNAVQGIYAAWALAAMMDLQCLKKIFRHAILATDFAQLEGCGRGCPGAGEPVSANDLLLRKLRKSRKMTSEMSITST